MKAKECIEKYRSGLKSYDFEEIEKAINDLIIEMSQEATKIMAQRGAVRVSAIVAVMKEQNDKWNAIVKEFPEILQRDGFKRLWLHRMPELQKVWR